MSVITLSIQELNKLYSISIILNNDRSLFTRAEIINFKRYLEHDKDSNLEVVMSDEIKYFINRLYISNKLAYAIRYKETQIDIEDISDKLNFTITVNNKQGLGILQELKYNLKTDGGYSFVSKEDMEFLEKIEYRLLNKLVKNV